MALAQRAASVLLQRFTSNVRPSAELRKAFHRLPAFQVTRELSNATRKEDVTSPSSKKAPTDTATSSSPEQFATSLVEDKSSDHAEDSNDPPKPGALGGFMRGLIGGQAVAVEDAFVAEAKQQGVDLPPPPPQRHATLVPVRRRKRNEEGDEESEQTIRDRIFSRFAGSSFMKNAFDAQQRIRDAVDESDNPVINMFRNLYDRVFAENEMGMVVREIREEDPNFRISEFLEHVESDLIPSILGAYLRGDRSTLSSTCTQDAYAMLNASIRERETEGIVMDTNVLDIGDVELTAARLLEDSPVLIVTFYVHQVNCVRDTAGQVVEGREDDIRAVYYAWALVREAEFEDVSPSGGGMGADRNDDDNSNETNEKAAEDKGQQAAGQKPWKLMEMVIRAAHRTI